MVNDVPGVGEYVVYGPNGVCRVDRVETKRFSGSEKHYLILVPESSPTSIIYIPRDSEALLAKMRPVMTKKEIDELLVSARDCEIVWDDDRKARIEDYKRILSQGIRRDLLLMIRCIYLRGALLAENGKKLPSQDESMMKSAIKLVRDEFAFTLGIPADDVDEYIRSSLEGKKSKK